MRREDLQDFFGIIDMKLQVFFYNNCWQLVSVKFSNFSSPSNRKKGTHKSRIQSCPNNKIWWRRHFSNCDFSQSSSDFFILLFQNNFASFAWLDCGFLLSFFLLSDSSEMYQLRVFIDFLLMKFFLFFSAVIHFNIYLRHKRLLV